MQAGKTPDKNKHFPNKTPFSPYSYAVVCRDILLSIQNYKWYRTHDTPTSLQPEEVRMTRRVRLDCSEARHLGTAQKLAK